MVTKTITYTKRMNNGKIQEVTKTIKVYTEEERDQIRRRTLGEFADYLEQERRERRRLREHELEMLYGRDRSLDSAIEEYIMNVRDFNY